ncbi:hypothetical protein [Hyalangium gracile]|uniref:hypothetical protein n=1 Tax=Hyalangium gracile TaxID=394092 RepID=UPI001CCB506C|nr:hypothetical protein [Hyalangium gracile]
MVGDILFGLGANGRVYMNRDGTLAGWKDVGGPVEWIHGGTGKLLCARIPAGWGGACFDVNTERWTVIGQP